jgi:hypothetical protein
MSEHYDGSDCATTVDTGGPALPVHRRAGSDGGAVSLAVVEALAEARGVSPLELDPPLFDAVDPEALDELFAASDAVSKGRVVFTVDDHEVTVTADDDVYVEPVD